MSLEKDESKKNVRANVGSNFFKRNLPKIIITSTLVISLGYGSFHYAYKYVPTVNEPLFSIVNEKEDTLFDDILGSEANISCRDQMYNYESLLRLNDKIDSLGYEKYSEGLAELDTSNLSQDDILTLIEQYNSLKGKVDLKTPTQETIDFYRVVAALSSYDKSLNAELIPNMDIIYHYADLYFASLVMDYSDVSIEEISSVSNNIRSNEPFKITYVERTSGKTFELSIGDLTNLNNLVNHIRTFGNMLNGEIEATDEEKIDAFGALLNEMKYAATFDYSIIDGKIKQKGNNITHLFK